MRVGIDLDNTIINYNKSFGTFAYQAGLVKSRKRWTKETIKEKIIKNSSENDWSRLQSKVYGEKIKYAELFSGVETFFNYLNFISAEIFIVSHKTKYPYIGKKINLRKKATQWILSKFKKLSKNQILFADTIDKKVKKITELNLDYFIDDLELIFLHSKFPKKTNKILFGKSNKKKITSLYHWKEILIFFIKKFKNKNFIQINNILVKILDKNYTLKKLSHIGNQNVFLASYKKKKIICKVFPNCDLRIKKEIEFYKFLSKNKIFGVPKLLHFDKKNKFLILENINGIKIKSFNFKYLKFFLNFIKKVNSFNFKNYKYYASDAAFSDKDYEILFERKLASLINNIKINKNLAAKKRIIKIEKEWLKLKSSINFNGKHTNNRNFILSPSDVGMHNMLLNRNRVFFFDFEHSGIDDPIKLINDFILQPQLKIPKKYYNSITKRISELFFDSNKIYRNAKRFRKYFILRWALITLNIFNDQNKKKKEFLDFYNNNYALIKKRLNKCDFYIKLLKDA